MFNPTKKSLAPTPPGNNKSFLGREPVLRRASVRNLPPFPTRQRGSGEREDSRANTKRRLEDASSNLKDDEQWRLSRTFRWMLWDSDIQVSNRGESFGGCRECTIAMKWVWACRFPLVGRFFIAHGKGNS